MKSVNRLVLALFVVVVSGATASAQTGYTNLLQDRSLQHWMTQSGDPVENGWTFDEDGSLHLQGRGGNIITRRQYCDFELWFEFRISEKGNSGIKYRVKKYGGSLLGCEFQILDDEAFPKLPRNHLTASLYDVFEPIPNPTRRHRGDEWNVGHILVRGNHIQHSVNYQQTINVCAGSAKWNAAVANSKFDKRERFGQNRLGRIMLTDHNSEVWYRNIFIAPR